LSLAVMRGLDDRLLCSHFVSIAEVDKRRLIHALYGCELLKTAEDLTAEKQERRKLIHRYKRWKQWRAPSA
jgi:histone acetyltransferase (RNA polymerase elongator complex component)